MGFLSRVPFFNRKTGRDQDYKPLESRLQYRFKNRDLLEVALTHGSIEPNSNLNYERMEFLGDAVIDEVLSGWLYHHYPYAGEGALTKRRSAMVNNYFLHEMALRLQLNKYIRIDASVSMHEEKVARNIISDVFESVTAAIYLDGGFASARKFLQHALIANESMAEYDSNYKGNLIEYCHRRHFCSPVFSVNAIHGPEHKKEFTVSVTVNGGVDFTAKGKSKKEAEQLAAKIALDELA